MRPTRPALVVGLVIYRVVSRLVDVERIGVAFPPDVLEHGDVGAARIPGVDVQVAAHHLCILAVIGPPTSSASSARVHWTRWGLRENEAQEKIG